jgi:hypothetical protein
MQARMKAATSDVVGGKVALPSGVPIPGADQVTIDVAERGATFPLFLPNTPLANPDNMDSVWLAQEQQEVGAYFGEKHEVLILMRSLSLPGSGERVSGFPRPQD